MGASPIGVLAVSAVWAFRSATIQMRRSGGKGTARQLLGGADKHLLSDNGNRAH